MKIRITFSEWFGHSALHYGIEHKNNFKYGEKLEFEIPTKTAVADYGSRENLLINNQVDIVAHSIPGAMRLLANHKKLGKIIGVESYSAGAEGIIAKNYIKNLCDLEDKKVAIPSEAFKYYVSYVLREKKCLRHISWSLCKDIEEIKQRFIKCRVDAVCIDEPYLSEMSRIADTHTLITTAEEPGNDNGIFTVRADFLEKERELIKVFLQWFYEINEFVRVNRETIAQFQAKRTNLNTKTTSNILSKMKFLTREENKEQFDEHFSENIYNVAEKSLNVIEEFGEIEDKLYDVKDFFDTKFIRNL